MATKKYAHNDLSNKVCSTDGCNKRLKRRIVELKPDADKCYRCHQVRLAKQGRKHRDIGRLTSAARREAK